MIRLFQQQRVMVLAFLERNFRRFALGDFRINSRLEAASSTVRWLNVSMNFFNRTAASRALRCVFSIGVIATAKKIPACLISAEHCQPGCRAILP